MDEIKVDVQNRMKFDRIDFCLTITIGFLLIVCGWFGHLGYQDWNNEKQLAGLWISGLNATMAKERAYDLDNSGQWVCVNVDKTMTYSNIVEVCNHEAGHELFARKCADNPQVCFDLEQREVNITNEK